LNFLTRFGLARSRFTVTVMAGLLAAGLALYPNFPKREDPVVVIRTALVSAQFPGMTPERMEDLVAVPIERKVRELAEVKDIRTLTTEGSLVIYVDLKDEVGDVNAVWQRLRDKMNDVKIELPEGVLGPFVNSDFGDVAIATMAITAEGFSYREMKDAAETLRKKLYQVSGVAKVELFGVQDERVWLEIDTRKLASVGVQLNALTKDLQRQNVILPSGTIDADGTRILLETSGDFPDVRAIETMLTRVGTTDSLVRLSDLVTVRRGYVSPKVKPVFFNGRPAVVLSVMMQPDQDVTQLGERLRAAARQYQDTLPIGYVIDFATYQAQQVRAAVSSALSSVAQTFIVVGALVILFLGLRAGLVAAMIVPFAVMFSVIGMRALGIALEQVSIAAVIIALGLLVDNGVVIVEDIMSRTARGVAPEQAALASGQQYAFPLLVSSVTTVAAFLPLFLLSGASGEYAYSLAVVVALTLTGSWTAALYILPALTIWLIGRRAAAPTESRLGAQNHPEASFEIKRLAMGSVESGIVEVEISGPDADRLLALGEEVRSLFRRAPGIRENDDDWGNKVIKVVVDINQDRVRRLGITSEEITQMLKTYFTGSAVSTYREGDNTIPIVLRAGAETHQSAEGLASATFAHNGALVALAQIATLRTGLDFSRIRRKNQERTIIVTGRSASLTAGELLNFIQPGLRALDLSGGYQVDIGGEIQKSAETNGKLAAGIPAALAIMVLAIILQFNSLRRTLLTFLTIPLILVGIPYGLLATGQPLSFFGTLGIISLAGIIINNAIVLIDQIDIERAHVDLPDAIIAASRKRLRPILLTSATTVLGLAPMAVAGGALWQPMAVLMMSGLAVASLLTLLFVPAGYFVLFRFDRASDRVSRDAHRKPAMEKVAS
jgi:multidrug efflux pump subunit AcrB